MKSAEFTGAALWRTVPTSTAPTLEFLLLEREALRFLYRELAADVVRLRMPLGLRVPASFVGAVTTPGAFGSRRTEN